jgi:hypothetical protein
MLTQEISSPYVPNAYAEELHSLYVAVNREVMVKRVKNKYNQMSKKQLLTNAFDGEKIDVNVFSFFLAKFANAIEQNDLIYINQVFSSNKINNGVKIFILEQIKLAELTYTFDFYNNLTKQHFKISSTSVFEFEQNTYYQSLIKQVNVVLNKDPSSAMLATEICKIIFEYIFNAIPPYSANDLAQLISNYVLMHFDNRRLVDNEFQL